MITSHTPLVRHTYMMSVQYGDTELHCCRKIQDIVSLHFLFLCSSLGALSSYAPRPTYRIQLHPQKRIRGVGEFTRHASTAAACVYVSDRQLVLRRRCSSENSKLIPYRIHSCCLYRTSHALGTGTTPTSDTPTTSISDERM